MWASSQGRTLNAYGAGARRPVGSFQAARSSFRQRPLATFAHGGKDWKMLTMTIEAATPESAVTLYRALVRFRSVLHHADDGRRFVAVELGGDREIVEVLNAVEDYVTNRSDGPARVELDGHVYTLHAAT